MTTSKEMFERISPKTGTTREFVELLAKVLSEHENMLFLLISSIERLEEEKEK